VKLVAAALLVACGHAMPPATSGGDNVALGSATTGTIVVTLAPNMPTAIVDGPFAISSINPGRELMVKIGACSSAAAWFSYSGGGIVIGAGQSLCVRSVDSAPATHGFSGRRE
jgi:hypothetical protein